MSFILAVHYQAILIATLVSFAAGWGWYHQALFGARWAQEQSHRTMPDDFQRGMKTAMIAGFFENLLSAILTIALFVILHIGGVICFALFMLASSFAGTAFKGGTVRLWAIDAGYMMLRIAIALATVLIIS